MSYHVPYLRVANVYANELRLDSVAEIGCTESEAIKTRLQKGDLLIVEGNGSIDQIGRVALWNGEIDNCSHQNHLIRARLNSKADAKYSLYWLLSPKGRSVIERVASSSSGLHTLSISKVQGLPIPICDRREQCEIVARIVAAFARIEGTAAEAARAAALLDLLEEATLAMAFRGQLVSQDPNDEPASVLLERLSLAPASESSVSAQSKNRKSRVAKVTPESVKDIIRRFPKNDFSFNDLRTNVATDYESLRDILFILLSETDPILTQVLDQEAKEMKFARRQP